MKTYADTSFLASLYIVTDARHAQALAIQQTWTTPPRLPLTPFGMLELHSVLARMQHKGKMHMGDVLQCENLIKQDLKDGILEKSPLRAYEWMQAAMRMVDNISPLTGTRTLDAMHLAIARLNGATTIISFDKNQRLAAQVAGFALLPASI